MTSTSSSALDVDDAPSRPAPEVQCALLDGREDAGRDAVVRYAA